MWTQESLYEHSVQIRRNFLMKNKLYLILTVLLTIFAYTLNTFAQDYIRWGLPEGVKVRFGKGGSGEIAYSPDGSKLVVASDIGVWIYDAHTGEELDLYIGHTGNFNTVTFSPDGKTIASGSRDNTISLWDVDTGEEKRIIEGHTAGLSC
ncbi:hypothetical protein F4083_10790, partial [Candidatus Poribacteria bacterium]|nr:hypothetical protein [Candidatus Poribacteria bacterium]